MSEQLTLPVEDSGHVSGIRRQATRLLAPLGFGETALGNVALAITEAGTNLLRHATRGQILLRLLERSGERGLELVALDQGPGIRDLGHVMQDGTSTRGTLGAGLGTLKRLSGGTLQIHSAPGQGTALRLELWQGPVPPPDALELGIASAPKPGEDVSGDGWRLRSATDLDALLVVDGLGHGPEAAAAARAAIESFETAAGTELEGWIRAMHGAIASTRGAAVGIAVLDPGKERGCFAGIGNIAATVAHPEGRRQSLMSHHGIVGHKLSSIRTIPFAFGRDSLLILHSDGLGTQWDLAAYPGLVPCHASLIAGVLFRDFWRGRDDVTVAVLRAAESR
jgi:anti-sigma regulatory factor (Ser/Thr protein kinase)